MGRFTAALRRHGPQGVFAAACRRAAALAHDARERALERAFDRRRGIDTAGVLRDGDTPYQPVHPAAFAEFMAHVPVRGTFVDIGSGRGRGVILAVEHGFERAVGVEVDPVHHAIALANVRRYPAIELTCGDALDFEFPDGELVVFIYNPFPRTVMERFVTRIPERAWIVYEAPLDRDLFDARFELIAERTERISPRRPRFAIYRPSRCV
jgi:SAM-dependent methyltransferase